MAYPIKQNEEMTPQERIYVPELIRGLAITARHFFANLLGAVDNNPDILKRTGLNKVTTVQYPEEKVIYPPGYRGLHRLVPREDGKPRCVACYMCATVCPAQCIYIEAGEYPVDDKAENSVIEKFPTKFVIDELRCVVCGFCVEACPKDAIRMDTGLHTPPGYDRAALIWDIPRLLRGPAVSHPSDPWNKRDSSKEPEVVPKEALTKMGSGGFRANAPKAEE